MYVHFNSKRLAVFLNSFLLLQSFLGEKNAKIDFLKKNGFESSFIKLTFKWLQTGLSDLKNTKQLKFCLWWIFYSFLKCCIFQKFSRFLKYTSNSW